MTAATVQRRDFHAGTIAVECDNGVRHERRNQMKSRARTIGAAAALLLFAGTRGALAQPVPTTVDGLIGAAKNAAGLEWPSTFLRLCIPPPPAAPAPATTTARGTPPAPPARETWYGEPAKVADNLYF